MADTLTIKQRKRCMSRIKGKDTTPEMVVRSLVHALGYRFRLHRKDLPGKPDLVLPRHKKVIFVHGCFWHMHTCKKGKSTPATNVKFWKNKREGNKKRDRRNIAALKKQGWEVLVVWECQLKNPDKLQQRIADFLF